MPGTNQEAAALMHVRKRNGTLESVNVNKIVRAVARCAEGLTDVDPMRVAVKTIGGLFDGATTAELDQLSIRTSAGLIAEEPQYSRLAARLLASVIDKEINGQDIHSFSQSIQAAYSHGLVSEDTRKFVASSSRKLNNAARETSVKEFEYFGLRTVYDRYLLRHPETRHVLETPTFFLMRVACGLAEDACGAIEFFKLMAQHRYLPSTPTLFNSGSARSQMSSCYLLDSPQDNLDDIYDHYKRVARLSKHAGGIGHAFHRVRSRGSYIKGTNGYGNGIVPWLKTEDSSVGAVNQCFSPDTVVYAASGPKQIKDIQAGDLVLGSSGNYREVLRKFDYDQKGSMVEVNIKHSILPIRVSSGHPFWCIKGIPVGQTCDRSLLQLRSQRHKAGWVDAGYLCKGDYVAQVIPQETVLVEGTTPDDARLYGILLGDGHLSKGEWGVSCGDMKKDCLDFVRSYLSRIGVHYWETSREGCTNIRWATGRGAIKDPATGRVVSAGPPTLPFSEEDIYDSDGCKCIAKRFLRMPRLHTLALVKGLLETDGCISRGKELSFTNTSAPLVNGIRYQLLRLGVPTSGQHRKSRGGHVGTRKDGSKIVFKANCLDSYDVCIPPVEEIANLVGCKPIKKKNWLVWGGCVWTRVIKNQPIAPVPTVHDLEVDCDETYQTGAALVHNGGKRLGACCVYLEVWHADIEEFLELRDNTGDQARRAYNLNLACWVPDLFMRRVESGGMWSLFDPKIVSNLPDLWGEAFDQVYADAEIRGLAVRQIPARDLYARMMKTLGETGNGWMTWKDACNRKCNQTLLPANVVHCSNLCSEICEVNSLAETAVCNLGSVNLGQFVADGGFDFPALARTVETVVPFLDRVIDRNYYPTKEAHASNTRWRPVGLGVMGLQDVFFKLRLPFDCPEARALSRKIQEEIYFHALSASCRLSEANGPHPSFAETHAAQGTLQFDLWGETPQDLERWGKLKERIKKHGLRNSLLIAIAPTATIASILGCCECIEPQVSNLFKRETLSGEFLQVNRYLVEDLKRLGLWTEAVRSKIKAADGSVAGIEELPPDLRLLYRTVWEIPMRSLIDMAADRGPWVDQSQSLNLFLENPTIGKMASMYMHAWKRGLKTTYYLRSRPATGIAKVTTAAEGATCPVDGPCEACQ